MALKAERSDFSPVVRQNDGGARAGLDENVFFPLRSRTRHYLLYPYVYVPGSSREAAWYSFQMRLSQSSCSGFISTERRQVIRGTASCASAIAVGSNHDCGNCTRARCRLCRAQASKVRWARRDDSSGDAAAIFQTTMSSSEAPAESGTHCPSAARREYRSSAARRPAASPFANAPPGVRGSRRCVAQSATAADPAREHSRLISPRCNSVEVK